MFRNTHRLPKQLAAAIAVVALAAPATSAAYQDHRSPDAVDAAIEAKQRQSNEQHLRGLEARRTEPGYVDHRSPDAQDSGFVRSPEPAKIVESSSFDWGDAGIGAGGVLGLLLISMSVMFTVTHRGNRTATT